MTGNKTFSATIASSYSDKSKSSERIVLIENDEIVMEHCKVALTLNTFFSNIVTRLKFRNLKTVILCQKEFPSKNSLYF